MTLPVRVLRPTLEEVEDAIVAALQADATIAAYIADITVWQGSIEEALQEAMVRDPAMLVMCGGGEFEERGPEEHVLVAQWHVVVRHRNLRGEAYRRRPASAAEVGTYQMVQDVLRVLAVQDLGLEGLRPLAPQGFELLQSTTNRDRTQSAYVVVFEGELDHAVVEPSDDDRITSLELTYELRNEPDDTFVVAASDTVTLEEG